LLLLLLLACKIGGRNENNGYLIGWSKFNFIKWIFLPWRAG